MVAKMALSTGDKLLHDSSTPGDYKLEAHASNANSLNKIKSRHWDFVSLQGQSQETSLTQSQMEADVYIYAKMLCDAIRTNDLRTETLFYMTWGRKNGDTSNCAERPWVCNYEGMDEAIKASYTAMAKNNDAALAPVGTTWRYIRANYPDIDLYDNDGSRPDTDYLEC